MTHKYLDFLIKTGMQNLFTTNRYFFRSALTPDYFTLHSLDYTQALF